MFRDILVSVFVLLSLHGGFNTFGEGMSYLELDLEEDVEDPTAPSCGNRRRAVKRSENPSPDEEPEFYDDCIVYGDTCPKKVKISWLHVPPFLYDSNGSHSKGKKMKGIFHDILNRAIRICCKAFAGTIPELRFLKRATRLKDLQKSIIHGQADIIVPVQSDEAKYGGSFPFVKILDSPGAVLIQNRASFSTGRGTNMWKAVLDTWPVIVMALSMSSLAGIFIWLLDTWQNSEQFPRKFPRGAFEGFWWAIVTMSTVGYGDKTPKSVLARLFAVVWILIGITMCSVMTASLSSALTSVTIAENYDVTTGKKIGVLKDSVALQDAVSFAANITDFDDLDEMYQSLVNGSAIDGVVEELFSGIEFLKMKDKSKYLSVSKFIQHTRGHGVAYRNKLFTERVSHCLSNVIRFRSADVISLTRKYLKATEDTYSPDTSSTERPEVTNIFDHKLPLFKGLVIALCASLLLVFVFGMAILFLSKLFPSWKPAFANAKKSVENAAADKVIEYSCLNGKHETEV